MDNSREEIKIIWMAALEKKLEYPFYISPIILVPRFFQVSY